MKLDEGPEIDARLEKVDTVEDWDWDWDACGVLVPVVAKDDADGWLEFKFICVATSMIISK